MAVHIVRCTCIRRNSDTTVGPIVVPDDDCPAAAVHAATGR